MRGMLVLVSVVVFVGLAQPASAGGWEEGDAARGVIHVPTAVYYPAHARRKACIRHPRPGCFAHPYTVVRYAGTEYPRYFYRWRGYGWNR